MSKSRCSDAQETVITDGTVVFDGRFEHKQREVSRYRCQACGRCALVPSEILDDPDLPDRSQRLTEALEKSSFCADAIEVVPCNVGQDHVAIVSVDVLK